MIINSIARYKLEVVVEVAIFEAREIKEPKWPLPLDWGIYTQSYRKLAATKIERSQTANCCTSVVSATPFV